MLDIITTQLEVCKAYSNTKTTIIPLYLYDMHGISCHLHSVYAGLENLGQT